jgi:hypothetical protein
MSRPFDLAAAQRGELIEYNAFGPEWETAKFLGTSASPRDERIVIERVNRNGFELCYAKPSDLRMAPKKVTVRYRVAVLSNSDGSCFTRSSNTDMDATEIMERHNFVQWIHNEWQVAEVPQGGE